MYKRALLIAALVAISTVGAGTANAADISSWSELETNKGAENIEFSNDITAEGGSPYGPNPAPITFTSDANQTINGNYHSFSSQDLYTDRWYYYSLSVSKNGGTLNVKNLGKSSSGDASNNTVSYTDIDGNTVYKNIGASVNNWKGYFLTINKPITTNLSNSVFTDNGKDTDAKLIYVSGSGTGTLNVTDSIFFNNKVANVEGVVSGGRYNLNVENSVFYGNKNANYAGGALYGNGIVNVKNSYFINNVAEKDTGGAISLGGSATLTVEGSRFEGNSSNDDGGAISGWGSTNVALIKDSQFINNHNGGTYYDGGAISLGGGYIQTMDNVLFEGNRACSKGGGVYQGMNGSNTKPPILIKNTIFKDNEASTGGGYYTDGQGRKNYTYITDSEFTNNIAKATGHYMEFGIPVGGGMISAGNVPIIINNTTFTGNTADPEGNYSAGGGIYFAGESASYPIKIVDSTFTNNSAFEGGAIYIQNADTAIIAQTKDVIFSENTAGADSEDYNGGADIYFQANEYSATLSLNAAEGKKIVFNGSIASYIKDDKTSTININNSGVTYNTYDGETETSNDAGTVGEIQFNARVGDGTQSFSAINLYGGKLSIGQNEDESAPAANPDGYINDNNFNVLGDSTLNTVNFIIGEFAPKAFVIANGANMDYELDVDLSAKKADTLSNAVNNGTLKLSKFNIITDSDTDGLKIKYSNTNVNGTVKDGYSITTSEKTYDITTENDSNASYIIFSSSEAGGGLPAAIANESDQYIITNNKDEKVDAWESDDGNVITSDIDINANGHSIYTDNGLDGMVVSQGTNVILRNVEELSGFNNALTNDGGTLSIVDSNVKGNSGDADVTNNGGTVNIEAKSKDMTIGSDGTDNALISNGGTVNVKGADKVTFNGNVKGSRDAQMNVSTDTNFNGNVSDMNINQASGTVNVKNLTGGDYSMNDGTLNLNKNGSFAPETFELNNGKVNIANESAFSPQNNILNGGNINAINKNTGNLNFNTLTLKNTVNLAVDVDLKNQIMDTISASSVNGNGKINVNQFNILSQTNKSKISIPFAKGPIKTRVSTGVKTLDGKIFRYNVNYDSKTGYFNMSGGGNDAKGYNPAILASPVATLIGGQITQSQTLQDSFFHMNRYMKYSSNARIASEDRNKYALSELHPYPTYVRSSLPETSQAMWVKPYTTFEKVKLKGGVGVSNVAYGALYGGDTNLVDLGRGYKGVISAFVGYNGSHQSYNGISMNQQGGTLGVTGTLYHGNFFTGLTFSAGASAGEAHTPYGTDHFSMLTAGVANKTGYNIELADGKFIIQPSLYLGYTFVNNFDYTNSAGVKIDSDPLSMIQIAPGIKFIGNLKNGWQPYAGVDMMWNIMGRTKFKAADSRLPELSVKPYIQYGVGLQKSWSDRFTAFFQTMLRNGGRTGIVLEGGFRWTIGKDSPSKTKVENSNINKKTDNCASSDKVVKKGFWSNLIQRMDGASDVAKAAYSSKKIIKKM